MAKKPIADTKNLFKRGSVWYINRMVDGRRLIQSTGETTLDAARAYRDKVLNPLALRNEKDRAEAVLARVASVDAKIALLADAAPALSVRHGWQAYVEQPNRPDTGPATMEVYRNQYEAFALWVARNRADVVELRHVSPEVATAYAAHLLKRISATTFNRHLNLLALVWRVLFKAARLTVNPWTKDTITRKKFVAHSRRELTVEEVNRALNAATGEMRVLLALGVYCGLRLGDAATLQWTSVDLVRGVLSLVPHKTERKQKRVTLPIHPTLHGLLAETSPARRKGFVVPALQERYESFDGALAKDVLRLFQGCGIATKQEKPECGVGRKEPRKVADCGFHSLRHTFVSLCAAGGVSQSVVQNLVGHGSPAMTAHYTHISLDVAQRAIAALPAAGGTEAGPKGADATGARLGAVLAMLEGLNVAELTELVEVVQDRISKEVNRD